MQYMSKVALQTRDEKKTSTTPGQMTNVLFLLLYIQPWTTQSTKKRHHAATHGASAAGPVEQGSVVSLSSAMRTSS